MANNDYHFHCGKIRRSEIAKTTGKSRNFCDKANYIIKEPIYCERTDELFKRTDNNHEVLFSEVFLPKNAKSEWKDPKVLANAVENYEKHAKAKLGYDIDGSIPYEFDKELAIEIVKKQAAFLVSKGMCVIAAIHWKEDNPHVHFLCTARSLDSNGDFLIKEKKVFSLDKNGKRIPVLDEKGNQKMTVRKYINKNGEECVSYSPQFKRERVYEDPLNDKGLYKEIRHNWAVICNEHLSQDNQISELSYADRHIDKIPGKHVGYAGTAIAKRGGYSYRTEINEEISIKNEEKKLAKQTEILLIQIKNKIELAIEKLQTEVSKKLDNAFKKVRLFFMNNLEHKDRKSWNKQVEPRFQAITNQELATDIEEFIKSNNKNVKQEYPGYLYDSIFSLIRTNRIVDLVKTIKKNTCEDNKENASRLIEYLQILQDNEQNGLKRVHTMRI